MKKVNGYKFDFDGIECWFEVDKYGNGCTAINFMSEEGPYGRLTTNLAKESVKVRPNFYIKDWSENEDISAAAWRTGLFVKLGEMECGYAIAKLWGLADGVELE
jgi:hypothetical protein